MVLRWGDVCRWFGLLSVGCDRGHVWGVGVVWGVGFLGVLSVYVRVLCRLWCLEESSDVAGWMDECGRCGSVCPSGGGSGAGWMSEEQGGGGRSGGSWCKVRFCLYCFVCFLCVLCLVCVVVGVVIV